MALHISTQANAFIATYDPSIPNHRYSSPNKIFEAMMLAKPVVVAKNTNMDRIVEFWECGLVVEYGNLVALEQALSMLANDLGLQTRLGKNGRKAYKMEYSWEKMQERLLALYHELTPEGKSWLKSY
jgi:glycosyltransferase involved in cell wall biosynthesis